MKVSVIIPVFKVEEYLERCVNSVINQRYSDLQIILVDDGSPDRCPRMCDDFAKKDKRIKVIHKQNGGLSDARNAGLDVANGDYVTFLDSDDYFFDNFSNACELVEKNQDCDVLSFGSGIDKYNKINYPISACMKFFKLSFLKQNNIKFVKGVYHEDVPFSLEILLNTQKIKTFNENFYYYDKSSNTSITREKVEDKFFKRFKDIYHSIDKINNKYSNILNEKEFTKFLSRTRFDSIKLARCIKNKSYQEEMIKTLKENKKYFKHPKTFVDFLLKMFWSVFGTRALIKAISKL